MLIKSEDPNDTTKIQTSAQLQACGLELCITRHAWDKLIGYCRATDLEVSGFMLLERDGNLLMVSDVYIPHQVCTSTSTEMDSTSIAKLQLELYKKKIIGQPDSKVKLAHFHTHPTFNVFWSSTDMEMRATLSKGVDYYVSLVINQKGDALAAIDINGEFPMSINNLPIEILDDGKIAKACKAEVALKVHSPHIQVREYQGYDGNYGYGMLPGWPGSADEPPRHERFESKLLGLADRRALKKKREHERKAFKLQRQAGIQTWSEWQLEQERKDLDRRIMRQAQSQYSVGADGIIESNSTGTYENIGGEIVKIAEPEPLD